VIRASHLSRKFGRLVAVDDVSFEIGRGEVVGLLGLNGAGKTTILRILAGFLPASSGGVSVAGFDVLRESMEVRRRIGYLAESVPLYREHRVEEMCEFQGRLHGLSRQERRERIPEVLDRVGLLDRRRQLVGNLSRGLRQRAGLAVALLPRPEVLILDEPTSGLDPLQRLEVRCLVEELAAEHTVILSSHILPEIEAVCPRVLILHDGQLVADGTREELVETLGEKSHIRLEADLEGSRKDALEGLRGLAGVSDVAVLREQDGYTTLSIECTSDLRREIGALAARKGWVIAELAWVEAKLEELFARVALGLDAPAAEHGAEGWREGRD